MNKLWVLLILLQTTLSQADDQEIDQVYELSADVRNILEKAPGGHPMPDGQFNLTTEQADQMKALASIDENLKDHVHSGDCNHEGLKTKIADRSFNIEAMVISSDTKFEQNTLGQFMSDDYINHMNELYQDGNQKAADVYTLDSLIYKFKESNPDVNLDKLNLAEKEKKLGEFLNNYLGKGIPQGVLMKEMAFQDMISNSDKWKETLSHAKKSLSSDQKIQLVSKLGGYFGNNYNFERSASTSDGGTFLDSKALLDSIKAGTPGGVCRDIALAQTQFLEELGFKNNYVVAFKTLTGSHATVISQDPETGKIVKFNYGETATTNKNAGTEALTQDTSLPDHGSSFRIYDTKGKPVAKIPSEVTQILRNATAGDTDRDFNQKNFSIAKVGFKKGSLEGNLFSGTTSSGDKLYGVAISQNLSNSENAKVDYGVSVSKLSGKRSQLEIDQDNFYFRANFEIKSNALKTGPFETRAIATASTDLLITNNKETNIETKTSVESSKQVNSDIEGTLGVQTTYTSPDKKTSVESKAYVTVYPDWDHVAKAGKKLPAINNIVSSTRLNHEISNDTKAMVEAAVVIRNYGTSMVVRAALEDEKRNLSVKAGGTVPLSKDVPTFLPGGEKRVFVGVEKATKRMVYSIEYERDLVTGANRGSLKAQGKFK